MKIKQIFALIAVSMVSLSAYADINLQAIYTDKDGQEITKIPDDEFTEEAPLRVRFLSNPSNLDPAASLVWHINNQVTGTNLTRYEQDIEFEFTEAGLTTVTLQVMLNDEVVEEGTFRITIRDSHLEMPNAFSPNGDPYNNEYRAKSNHRSIVEFHAYIFNRHGQKLYEWHDVNGCWDGTHNGHPVKDGVYFVYVKARGADGQQYEIRRDVNLIRNFNATEDTPTP